MPGVSHLDSTSLGLSEPQCRFDLFSLMSVSGYVDNGNSRMWATPTHRCRSPAYSPRRSPPDYSPRGT